MCVSTHRNFKQCWETSHSAALTGCRCGPKVLVRERNISQQVCFHFYIRKSESRLETGGSLSLKGKNLTHRQVSNFTWIRYCTAAGKRSSSLLSHFLQRKDSRRGKVFWSWLKTGGLKLHWETGSRTTVVTVFRLKTAWYKILRVSEVLQWLGSAISQCDSFMANC